MIDAVKLVTYIYRGPEGGFVEPVAEKAKDESFEALLTGLAVTLGSLTLR